MKQTLFLWVRDSCVFSFLFQDAAYLKEYAREIGHGYTSSTVFIVAEFGDSLITSRRGRVRKLTIHRANYCTAVEASGRIVWQS